MVRLSVLNNNNNNKIYIAPSVTRVDQSKTVEVRMMQLSPHDSSFLMLNFTVFTAKLQWEHRERGRQIREG